MPKAPPAVRRRAGHLADAIDGNAIVGRKLHAIDMRAIGNGTQLKESLRRARELQEELGRVLMEAIQADAEALS